MMEMTTKTSVRTRKTSPVVAPYEGKSRYGHTIARTIAENEIRHISVKKCLGER